MGLPSQNPRKILHVDMDAFYASVEQRDRPELKGKPVIVGGNPQKRGVVAASSYEARKYGVRSAMSSAQAYRLCPHGVFLYPDFAKYKKASEEIHAIFSEITPLVEPLSLDEAYLDVTENALGEPLARNVALEIKKRIRERTGLTASAGAGPNKFIAKIASDLRKPDGLTVIPPEKVLGFLETLPVEKIWGVGPATAKHLHRLGLLTAGDIRRADRAMLLDELGKYGPFLHDLSQGIDERPVESEWEPKSRGSETTFDHDTTDTTRLLEVLEELAGEVARDLEKLDRPGRTVTLKVRYADFTTITRSQTVAPPVRKAADILRVASRLLLEKTDAGNRPIRLLGVSMSGFASLSEPEQLWLDLPLP